MQIDQNKHNHLFEYESGEQELKNEFLKEKIPGTDIIKMTNKDEIIMYWGDEK